MGPYLLYKHINVEHSLLIDHVQGVLYDLSVYKLCSPMCSPKLHVNVQLGIGAHHMTATSMAIFQRFADGCGAASPTIGKLSKEVFGLLIKQ